MGGLAGQFLNSCHAVGFSVEGSLEAADRRGAVLQHLARPADPLRLQLI